MPLPMVTKQIQAITGHYLRRGCVPIETSSNIGQHPKTFEDMRTRLVILGIKTRKIALLCQDVRRMLDPPTSPGFGTVGQTMDVLTLQFERCRLKLSVVSVLISPAHKQVKVLIYHGGINGVYEAIYHGTPMVLLPLFADQFFTSARIQDKGMGVMQRVPEITEENFQSTIDTVISDPKFKRSAERLSAIYRDLNRAQSPLERAMFWIDHVLVHGGDHLRPRSADMGTIELYMLDVIAFLILMSVILMVSGYMVLSRCCTCCCRSPCRDKSRKTRRVKTE